MGFKSFVSGSNMCLDPQKEMKNSDISQSNGSIFRFPSEQERRHIIFNH